MLTGRLPYGAQIARARTKKQMNRIAYVSALEGDRDVPAWVDGALRKAVRIDPDERYEVLSEFLHDLRNPNSKFLDIRTTPLIDRNPLLFWKVLCLILVVINVVLLAKLK